MTYIVRHRKREQGEEEGSKSIDNLRRRGNNTFSLKSFKIILTSEGKQEVPPHTFLRKLFCAVLLGKKIIEKTV